jgi:hypothetical protein
MLFTEAILFSSCTFVFCFTGIQRAFIHLYFAPPGFGEHLYICILFHRDSASVCTFVFCSTEIQRAFVHLYFAPPGFSERLYVCILLHRDSASVCTFVFYSSFSGVFVRLYLLGRLKPLHDEKC